jgi:hypothetical protein
MSTRRKTIKPLFQFRTEPPRRTEQTGQSEKHNTRKTTEAQFDHSIKGRSHGLPNQSTVGDDEGKETWWQVFCENPTD